MFRVKCGSWSCAARRACRAARAQSPSVGLAVEGHPLGVRVRRPPFEERLRPCERLFAARPVRESRPAARLPEGEQRHQPVRAERARVSVESLKFHTGVAVQGGDALLYTRGGSPVRIQDGSAWSLRGGAMAQMLESAQDVFAWEHGALVVINRPVPDLVETLSRYFGGYIHFPQNALAHNVSGVFTLTDAQASIKQLASTLGLSVNFYGQALAVAI